MTKNVRRNLPPPFHRNPDVRTRRQLCVIHLAGRTERKRKVLSCDP